MIVSDYTKIKLGLDLLVISDGYLLENDISERAITHRLAEHYQKIFPEWNVDCEYNKNLDQRKMIEAKELIEQMKIYLEKETTLNAIQINELADRESIEDLKRQLSNSGRIKYIAELDVYIFLLEIDGKNIKKRIFPDIIIHHRGTLKNNIVFEAKKTTNHSNKCRLYDLLKLAVLTSSSKYNYKKGVFIDLPVDSDFKKFHNFKKETTGFKNVVKYLPKYRR